MKVEVLPGYHVDTRLRKEPFFPGEQFTLEDDKEAKRLIGLGVVKEATKGAAAADGNPSQQLNVGDTVKLVMAAANSEELNRFKDGESRKGVLDAIDKRWGQLDEQITIGAIANVHNPNDLDTYLAAGDKPETRPAVLEAIEKRRAELAQ